MLTHEKTLGFKIRCFFKFKVLNYLKVFKKYFFYEKRKRQLTNNQRK